LIYVPSDHTWYNTSSCLWAETTRISGKAAISNLYPELQDLFCKILGVEPPDIGSLVRELADLAKGNPDDEKVKSFIREINVLEPREAALDELKTSNILPVRIGNGHPALKSVNDPFAIVDRPEYGEAFEGEVPMLCFSLEEVRSLRPFLFALGLEGRYMSISVEERSRVRGGALEPILTAAFKQKAYAFYRYKSPGAFRFNEWLMSI